MPDLDIFFAPGPEEKPKEAKAGLLRPGFVRRPVVKIEDWFDSAALWEYVKTERRKGPSPLPVVQITHPGLDEGRAAYETAYFFGKQKEIANMDTRGAWDRVLGPFLDDVEEALNARKPKEVEGRLRFDVAPDSSLTLFYVER